MRPMTAGTSLSEAAVGRPPLLQQAACHPSLSEAAAGMLATLHCQKRQLVATGTLSRKFSKARTASSLLFEPHSCRYLRK